MKAFAYRAVHTSGKLHKGTLVAENENELVSVLGRKNLELIEARETRKRTQTTPSKKQKDEIGKQTFIGQMEDLLAAGIPFPEALALILETIGGGETKDRLTTIESYVRAGSSLSQAFAQQKGWFDPISLAIIEAGEQSGNMCTTFERLSSHLKKQKEFNQTLRRAIRYPLFLLCVAVSVTSFMMLWVVPQIVGFLLSNGETLPLATRLLITSAKIFAALWWLIPSALFVITGSFLFARLFSSSITRITDGWLLHIPFLGPIWHKLAVARLTASLTLLLKSGLSLPASLAIAKKSLNNRYLETLIDHAGESLLGGQSFSQATQMLFSPFLLQLIRIGEKSNQLPKVLNEIARTTEKEARSCLTSFLGALEPALTLLVGGLLAWIVLAVLGPLYGSLGSISGGL